MAMSPGPIDWRWFRRNLIAVGNHRPPLKIVEAGPNCAARRGEKPVLGRGGHNARMLSLVERGRGGRARRRKRSDFGRRRFASVAGETPAWLGAVPGVANATPRRDNARRRVSPRMAREPTDKVAVARDAGAADKAERTRKCHARLDSTHPCQSIAFGDSLRSGDMPAERTPRIAASSAGLRPEDILVYVERSQGRRNRPMRDV